MQTHQQVKLKQDSCENTKIPYVYNSAYRQDYCIWCVYSDCWEIISLYYMIEHEKLECDWVQFGFRKSIRVKWIVFMYRSNMGKWNVKLVVAEIVSTLPNKRYPNNPRIGFFCESCSHHIHSFIVRFFCIIRFSLEKLASNTLVSNPSDNCMPFHADSFSV